MNLRILHILASLKLTLAGMVLLGIGASLSYDNPAGTPVWVLVVPLFFLGVNLAAAIISNPRINSQPGLLLFHVSLLSIVILAGIGRLTHMDAHIELFYGQEFEAKHLLDVKAGPFHNGDIDKVTFVQGEYTVNYAAKMQRGLTFSHIKFKNNDGQWVEKVVGDDRPLVLEAYRFYTTHNKGFSAVLTWMPDNGEAITGTVNMPSYPLFEYKQDNRWTPPGGKEIKFWMQLHTNLDENKAWVLDGRKADGVLVVKTDSQRVELQTGELVELPGGKLKYESLTFWMGYRLFYDPTIKWLFVVSIMGVVGLSHYFWKKLNLAPWMDEKSNEDSLSESIKPNQKHLKS